MRNDKQKRAEIERKERHEREVVDSVLSDFARRQQERLSLERVWQLNMNFVSGNQYCDVLPGGEVSDTGTRYEWEYRRVYNHVAPIVETRCAKLSALRPAYTVRAVGNEDRDVYAAKLASDILNSVSQSTNLDFVIDRSTVWSETVGTAFYKVCWDSAAGRKIGIDGNGNGIYEGEVRVLPVSPFEIYPECLSIESLEEQPSILHARAVPASEVLERYGVEVQGEDVAEFSFSPSSAYVSTVDVFGSSPQVVRHDNVILIEKYEKPTPELPNGRLTIVAGDKLVYEGDLPYANGMHGNRIYPFVRQTCIGSAGSFFSAGIVDRLIPVQRAYNAVRNRKHEFLNRVAYGILSVEDGSVDVDELSREGLEPGKVLVYRQGATPPQVMDAANVPSEFAEEEDRLLEEFGQISGTSEIARSSKSPVNVTSATGLQLLIEQENTRLAVSIDSIRAAVREICRQILRLYKQFVSPCRMAQIAGRDKSLEVFGFMASDVDGAEVLIATDTDFGSTPAQKRQMIFDLYNAGLFTGGSGKVSDGVRQKVLHALGFGSFENVQDIDGLHRSKAQRENVRLLTGAAARDVFDDDALHTEEHIAFMLSEDFDRADAGTRERFMQHLSEHAPCAAAAQGAEVREAATVEAMDAATVEAMDAAKAEREERSEENG